MSRLRRRTRQDIERTWQLGHGDRASLLQASTRRANHGGVMLNRPDWRRLRRRAQRELQRGAGGLEQTWLRLRGRHLRLGITGFSGAGKTTLITSLIHHLSQDRKSGVKGTSSEPRAE